MMRLTRANRPDGYILGSYRIATAPERNSNRLTSFKSMGFDRPANSVGPWPTSWDAPQLVLMINPSPPMPAGVLPPMNSPLPGFSLQFLNGLPQMIPAHDLWFQSTRSRVLTRHISCCVDRPGERFHPIGPHSRLRHRPPSRPEAVAPYFDPLPSLESRIGGNSFSSGETNVISGLNGSGFSRNSSSNPLTRSRSVSGVR